MTTLKRTWHLNDNIKTYLISLSDGVSQLLEILESSDSRLLKLLQLASRSFFSSHWARPSSAARRRSSSIRRRSCSITLPPVKNRMQKLYFHSYIFSSYNDFKAQQYYRFNILRLEFIFCFIDSSNRNDIYIYTYINTVVSL